MSGSIDFDRYAKIIFIDTMVALEAKPLSDLPWAEMDSGGPILIAVVRQVMREVDKRKRDSRLGKRARAFSRLLAEFAESGQPPIISQGPPQVEVALVDHARIDWDALPNLDPEEADSMVVAQVLSIPNVRRDHMTFMSHDANPLSLGRSISLPVRRMPDNWLSPPEPSPHDKELQRLKERVKQLEAAEPALVEDLAFQIKETPLVYQIAPLTEDERLSILRAMLDHCPVARTDSLSLVASFDYTYDGRLRKYRDTIAPRHANQFTTRLEAVYGQFPFKLTLSNTGHIQAENLVVKIAAECGWLHDRFVFYPVLGPPPPRPEPGNMGLNFPSLRDMLEKPGRHDVFPAFKSRAGRLLEFHCEDFRHGTVWQFEGFARVDPSSPSPFIITVELTASNMRSTIHNHHSLAFHLQCVEADELVDCRTGRYVVPFPLAPRLEAAYEQLKFGWIDRGDDD